MYVCIMRAYKCLQLYRDMLVTYKFCPPFEVKIMAIAKYPFLTIKL